MTVIGRCWTIFEPDQAASPAAPAMFLPGEHRDMPGYHRVVVVPATTQRAVHELAEAKAEAAAAKLVVGLMIADHTSTEAEAEEMARRYTLKALAMRKGQ